MWYCDIMLRYNKSTESWRYNDLYNASIEVSLAAYSELSKEEAYHLPVVILTKYRVDADKPIPVVNLPPVRFIVGPISQGRNSPHKDPGDQKYQYILSPRWV